MKRQWLVLVNAYVECETAQEAEDSVLQSVADGRNYAYARIVAVYPAREQIKRRTP